MQSTIHNQQLAIKLTNVNKKYEIHHEKPTLVEKFVKGPNETFWALKNVNLTIEKGAKVGIIGANGSGKTTLLKIISGIAAPTSGTVKTYGKVVSLIDLEAGFHEDLTGIQNIYLNGMLLGMSKQEITKKLGAIIRFADIHQFIDVPLFTYSTGMKMRLGFSIATHSNPDIFILDEGFVAGDYKFQERTMAKIQELFNQKKTILLVSQWLAFMEKTCKKFILMKNGIVHGIGGKEQISAYIQESTN